VGTPRFDQAVLEGLLLAKWYAREHVLICLVPAFFIAGAIAIFVSDVAVMRYLGRGANKLLAYGVASVTGTLLAVCSCTVLPLFASIHKRGAGLGPATAFLFSAGATIGSPPSSCRSTPVERPSCIPVSSPASTNRIATDDDGEEDRPHRPRQAHLPAQHAADQGNRQHVDRRQLSGSIRAGPPPLGSQDPSQGDLRRPFGHRAREDVDQADHGEEHEQHRGRRRDPGLAERARKTLLVEGSARDPGRI